MLKLPWARWGIVLGFALGGFFDGILLHQILQWHHLLSLVPGAGDMRMQVLWDGYFHALMYLIAAVGLWRLWLAHRRAREASGRLLLGALLVGFGVWHVVDGILSHWLLGIHRIKLDSANPLMWDITWFTIFGVLPIIIGWLLWRNTQRRSANRGSPAMLLVGALTAGAAAWALQAPADQPFATVVFRSGYAPADIFSAIAATDARLVWADPAMGVVLVAVAPDRRWEFYRLGALLVSGPGLTAGCFNWARA